MLNYEEELRKFKPSLEVDQIEEAVYKEDLTDMQDIVKEVMAKKEKKCCGNCFWFDNEDAYGQGWCIDEQCETSCGSICGNHLNR